jgi:hypothetical protein
MVMRNVGFFFPCVVPRSILSIVVVALDVDEQPCKCFVCVGV